MAAVLALGPWVQGCTLLFVAKSEVRYIQDPAPTVVPAASLSRQMSGRVVLRYKVRPGDTLRSIALLYYGDPSRAARVASDNHLRAGARLREGRTLRIVDPLDFPGP
ncbi:MAG TPA: LysM domain-containing protein, partial [bacterium]|nr:LysM domain-containing protein [bacterium]